MPYYRRRYGYRRRRMRFTGALSRARIARLKAYFAKRRRFAGRRRTSTPIWKRKHKIYKKLVNNFTKPPDVLRAKLRDQATDTITGVPCFANDVLYDPVQPQALRLELTANPNGGQFLVAGANTVRETFEPPRLFSFGANSYQGYRPMGMKFKITVRYADDTNALDVTPDTGEIARPIDFYMFLHGTADGLGNFWDGVTTKGYNTLDDFRYHWKQTLQGPFNRKGITFSHYIDFARVLGLEKSTYLAADEVRCDLASSNNPAWGVYLRMAAFDTKGTAEERRRFYISYDCTQYGRFEGLLANDED